MADFSKELDVFRQFEDCLEKYETFIENHYPNGFRHVEVCWSVRDWVESSLIHLSERFPADNNSLPKILDIFLFVVVADIIQKGVEKLFWCFFSFEEYKAKTQTAFFSKRREGESDDAHLSELRAVLGAHPFDIKKNKKDKRGCVHLLGDSPTWHGRVCATISKEGEPLRIIELDLSELRAYLSHRITLLSYISKKIAEDSFAYVNLMRNTPINYVESGTSIERIQQLCTEAAPSNRGRSLNRLDSELKELERYFSCSITSSENLPMVEAYRKALLPRIDYWSKVLQSMSFVMENISDEPLLDVYELGLPRNLSREFQEVVLGERRLRVLRRIFEKYFPVGNIEDREFELLIKAYLFTHPSWGKEQENNA